jgi:hypothetical protein
MARKQQKIAAGRSKKRYDMNVRPVQCKKTWLGVVVLPTEVYWENTQVAETI